VSLRGRGLKKGSIGRHTSVAGIIESHVETAAGRENELDRPFDDDPLLGEPGGIQEPLETFNSKYGSQSDENPGGHCR
jgi:hypothetical protein